MTTEDGRKAVPPLKAEQMHEPVKKESPRGGSRGEETRTLILDTAEAMFVAEGYSGVTMRALTARAGVNLAAVNYHFGSKDALLLEVFRRGSLKINRERARLLKQVLSEAADTPPAVRDILRTLFAPPIRATLASQPSGGGSSIYMQFVARAVLDGPPEMQAMIEKDVRHLQRFVRALACALPRLPRDELLWRFHFAMGALHALYHDLKRLDALAGGSLDTTDAEAIIERVVEFAARGLEGT